MKRCYLLCLLCLIICCLASSSTWGLEIIRPSPANLSIVDFSRDGIIFSWQADFEAESFTFEVWQMRGLEKITIFSAIIAKPIFNLEAALLNGEYFWQVTSKEQTTGVIVMSPIWQFYCQPWLEIYFDRTSLLILTLYPSELTMKWTDVSVASNSDIRLVFEEINLLNDKDEVMPLDWGFKQKGQSSVAWQTGQWQIFFQKPIQPQEFELWLRLKTDFKLSAGDYKAIVKTKVLFEED